MIDEDRDDFAKPDTNGADVLFSMFDKQTRAIIEKSVLEYNNKEPETTLEQFILPKERITKKGDNPESDDVEFDYTKIDPDILKKIEKSDFKDYCKENVKERSYWTFGKKQTMDQVLSYSKTMHGPILSIPKEVEGLAMKNFKRINAIINEKASKTAATNIIKRMIKMAVKNSAELRDEVFFQLIKQVRANNKQDCCYQAWSLLSVVCCFICPSESSIYYLLNYIKFMIDNFRDDEVKRSAKFVFVRLLKGYLTRGRGVLPCTAEIDLIRKKQKLSCRINLFTNGYLTVYFENYTVISDILKQICHMMEIDKEHFSKFGLLEVTTKPGMQVEETFVEEFIKLADVLASWEHEKLFYQRKTGVSFESKFELYFKIRFYFPLEKSVFRDSLLLYNEVIKALSVLLHL